MTKQEFLKKLKSKLKGLNRVERDKYIEYYDEVISDIVESGFSEEEAIEKQGSVDQVAEEILANVNPAGLRQKDGKGTALIIVSTCMVFVSLIALISEITFKMQFNTAVGIIGGADGPTSIFVAAKTGYSWGLYIVTVIVVIFTVVYHNKKRNK